MGPPIETPKGTRDWVGDDITLRNNVFDKIRNIFRLHGGTEIDTPAFERKSYLTEKYGEDTKLIYDLDEQGGAPCALRYDLTVPFARWLAMNNIRTIKRFQIGKVYRRDQPSLEKGRMREFFQCDFDYAGGQCDSMVPDAEVVCIAAEVFEALQLDVVIRINHRLILDGFFSAPEVQKEMVEKGLDVNVATKLGQYLQRDKEAGTVPRLLTLTSDPLLSANLDIQKGVEEMELLMQYLKAYGVADQVQFDLALARGLDYYTGVIYEVMLPIRKTGVSVGSIAAGGRYDDLVSMFSSHNIPCVGISFGIDRILTILKDGQQPKAQRIDSWIVIASSDKVLVQQRMALAREMRQAGISVDFDPKADKKPRKQIDIAEKSAATVAFLDLDDETPGNPRLKILTPPHKNPDIAPVVDRNNVIGQVKRHLAQAEYNS
ncbi:HisS Histidyl-tRNA synthetase [Pyrenophora tritici-repentis]|uniref:histidine--tRNA ligase n=1 Tax=Pyrenophora tritici-repentis TaxID=45151 RepID=A0A2W1D898_9PLEO|nr:histidyl-trna synthetase [Pyrenophora tritici-repentis]KAF7454201.1 histidyl-trna synthetase [Pyrenophora tritici-repentis]KAF7577293.1 HisS, Histidyl-tRNA synthetase [Pyrenophora tritici-repentis]KAI0575154.1 histidyl-trna synthetase [Pyrenophora tritici-repentis]KAI1521043.1 histidyl-trna synthetase [Pyrenophora tritici-repentis]